MSNVFSIKTKKPVMPSPQIRVVDDSDKISEILAYRKTPPSIQDALLEDELERIRATEELADELWPVIFVPWTFFGFCIGLNSWIVSGDWRNFIDDAARISFPGMVLGYVIYWFALSTMRWGKEP